MHLQLNHPKGGCITPLGRLKSVLWSPRRALRPAGSMTKERERKGG